GEGGRGPPRPGVSPDRSFLGVRGAVRVGAVRPRPGRRGGGTPAGRRGISSGVAVPLDPLFRSRRILPGLPPRRRAQARRLPPRGARGGPAEERDPAAAPGVRPPAR